MNQPNSSNHRPTPESHAVPPLANAQPPAPARPEPEPARWELVMLWLFIAGMALASIFVGFWLWLKCQ